LAAGCGGGENPTGVDNVLTSTTRWKPQRDTTKNIYVIFTGPKDILDPT
jgi:hypothetical protein